ncbi:esterase-like activity of phytase family protein [Sandarakinorhabdus sp. DWP1-3-1]|uniref:esterase-like activity of phytase family protein n=1 Tax=Sandarakinorhabdus sp. DWP1-3-1 TaxID=2804627 RepID=UPI003CF009DF
MQIERIFAGAVIAAALATGALAVRAPPALAFAPMALPLSATPLPLDRDDPGRSQVGALRFMGAVQLRSPSALFGGVSGLRAGRGDRMLAISDTGNWLAFTTVERGGRLVGVSDGVIAPILQPDGGAAATKADGDAEALEWDPASGTATIVYEQDHRLVHFAGIDADRPASLAAVPTRTERLTPMTGWPSNGGGEAIATLTDSVRIVISERKQRPDGSHIALLTRGGTTVEIGVGGAEDHAPTDAIALDDHRILVLNRRFSPMGQSSVLTLIDLAPALAGEVTAPLPARELARLVPPLTLDNMEGLAIRRSGGRTFLYMVSDDNLSGLQKTVLMKFELRL